MAVYRSSHEAEAIPQLIGIKTNIGGYFFDAFLKLDHTSTLKITEHPVEEGANIADHAYVEPQSLSIEIGMSDVCISFVNGQFTQKHTRSVSAFDTLRTLQENRTPLTVHTRLRTYENMLIETIAAPDDYTTLFGLRATISLREIIVASIQTIAMPNRVSAAPQKTGETKKGTVQAVNIGQNNETSSTPVSSQTSTSKSSTSSQSKKSLLKAATTNFFGR